MASQEMAEDDAENTAGPADYRVIRKNVEFALSFLERAAHEAGERGVVSGSIATVDQIRAQLEDVVAELQVREHFGPEG